MLAPAIVTLTRTILVVSCSGREDNVLTCPMGLLSSGRSLQDAATELACRRWRTLTGVAMNRTTLEIGLTLVVTSDVRPLRLHRFPSTVCSSVVQRVATGTMVHVNFRPVQFVKSTCKLRIHTYCTTGSDCCSNIFTIVVAQLPCLTEQNRTDFICQIK